MCEREGDDADVAVRAPRGVPAVLREDHPDGSEPAPAAAALRHLPRQDPKAATSAEARHKQELAGKNTYFIFYRIGKNALSVPIVNYVFLSWPSRKVWGIFRANILKFSKQIPTGMSSLKEGSVSSHYVP